MAAKTKSPATGKIHVAPSVLKDAIGRLRDAGAQHVSVRTHGRTVLLAGGDYNVQLELTLDCQFAGRLDGTVAYKTLRDGAASVGRSAELVSIEQTAKSLRLRAGRAQASAPLITGLAPAAAAPDAKLLVHAVGEALAEAVAAVAYAATKDETRPQLCAVLIESGAPGKTAAMQGPHLVATDSFRLTAHPLPGVVADGGDFRVAAFAPGLVAATKGLTGEEGVQILTGVGKRIEVHRSGERWLIAMPGYGEWPNWRQLIPTERPIQVTVEREELLAALTVAAKRSEATMEWRVPATVKVLKDGEGVEREFGIDPGYLKAAVAHAGEQLRIDYIGPLRPVRINSGDVMTLVMPRRLSASETYTSKKDVPLRLVIGEEDLTLHMKLPDPERDAADKAAKDLADVAGVAKRAGKGK